MITELEVRRSVEKLAIVQRGPVDDGESGYVALRVWIRDTNEAEAHREADQLADMVEEIEAELGLPVGRTVIVTHWS